MIDVSLKPIQINLSKDAFKYLRDSMREFMIINNIGGEVCQEIIDELGLNHL